MVLSVTCLSMASVRIPWVRARGLNANLIRV